MVAIGYRRDLLHGSLSHALDHLRWIAAFLVCANHCRNLMFPDAAPRLHLGALSGLFYFFTLFATESVAIFFVVSGLLVGGKLVHAIRLRDFSLGAFATDRATRLYIVLVPAVVLSLALLPFAAPDVFAGCRMSPVSVGGNLVFLQNVLFDPLCNNHPLWSLSNEAIYYLLAGFVAAALVDPQRWLVWLVLVAAVVGLAVMMRAQWQDALVGLPVWLFGLVPWFVRIRLPFYVPGALFLGVLALARLHDVPGLVLQNGLIGIALALTLAADWSVRLPGGAWAAGFSYSLYLVHMPLVQVAHRYVPALDPARPVSYLIFAAVIGAILCVAWLFGVAFESRTAALRHLIGTLVLRPVRRAV